MIRVVVVEDSATIRALLVGLLHRSPDFEVVGEADDGASAVTLCQRLRPDVVTMDMVLREMDGLTATREIMASSALPIVIVSSSTNRRDLFRTYDALAAGAVDIYEKPERELTVEWETGFLRTLRVAARVAVVTRRRSPPLRAKQRGRVGRQVIGIGASSGGPAALAGLFRNLPQDFPTPILVVNHISETLGSALPQWLDTQTRLSVRFAEHGAALRPGVLMAPPGRHMVLEDGLVRLVSGSQRCGCRPSVDVLFESLAKLGPKAMGVLLTGMGRDGAEGLRTMRTAGAMTIAQDEASSVVWGMPRAAVNLDAAVRVLPLTDIAVALEMTRKRS